MGIDADVLLRVRDRGALREALERRGEPMPLLRPLEDGSVSIFTGLRFHDRDADYAIRCWLADLFGDALARIHDDPRGVFISPDVCEPRAKTYDGIIAELGEAGRFVDPTPPTEAEHAERVREMEEYVAGMDVLRAAHEKGDEALAEALRSVPDHVREAWNAQMSFQSRMRAFASFQPIHVDIPEPAPGEGIDMAAALKAMLGDKATPELLSQLGSMFEADTEEAANDPRGHGRISAAVPPAIWKVLEKNLRGLFDVDDFTVLPDGSAVVVTTRLGTDEEDWMAQHLAAVVEEAGLDRASFGALPFFRESLVAEVADAPDLATVVERLGDRAVPCRLRTFDEAEADDRAGVAKWLRE